MTSGTKSTKTAYILNLLFPGIGSIYFGLKISGAIIFVIFLIAVSIVIATNTSELSIALKQTSFAFLPILLSISSIVIWVICVVIGLSMVYRKEVKTHFTSYRKKF